MKAKKKGSPAMRLFAWCRLFDERYLCPTGTCKEFSTQFKVRLGSQEELDRISSAPPARS